MSAVTGEYLTIEEAAKLLRVSTSTVRRWIREGEITAHRIGKRRIVLTKGDIASAVSQIRPESAIVEPANSQPDFRANPMISNWTVADLTKLRLTDAEKKRGLDALQRLKAFNADLRARTGRDRFSPSWILINEAREERTRQLWGDDDDSEAGS